MIINIHDLQIPIRGGVSKMEDKFLQVIELDLTIGVEQVEGVKNLRLDQTVDYVEVSRICKSECKGGFDLLENLAIRICDRIKKEVNRAEWVEISIRKRPQLGLVFESVEVKYKIF